MNKPVALITGASAGIGAATARLLAATHHIFLVARREERLAELVQAIQAEGGTAEYYAGDIAADGTLDTIVEQCQLRCGRLDVLIHNAGFFNTGAVGAYEEDQLRRMWELHVHVPMMLTQKMLPLLQSDNGGTIVAISSIAAQSTFTGCGPYSASKAALERWACITREELREANIRVSLVAPGATSTEIWGDADVNRTRMCSAEDVAQAICYSIQAPAAASVDTITITPSCGPL